MNTQHAHVHTSIITIPDGKPYAFVVSSKSERCVSTIRSLSPRLLSKSERAGLLPFVDIGTTTAGNQMYYCLMDMLTLTPIPMTRSKTRRGAIALGRQAAVRE